MSNHSTPSRRPRHAPVRRLATVGLFLVLAGCSASGGGCAPVDGADGTSTTVTTEAPTTTESSVPVDPDGSTTTTDPSATTTTVDPGPDGSTTTTVDPAGTTTTLPGGTVELVSVDALEPEMCVTPSADEDALRYVALNECDEPHTVETFAVIDIPDDAFAGSAYPGGTDLQDYAYERCQGPFEDYVGVPFWDSVYDITTIIPAPSTWAQGDREIVCLITDIDGAALTSSAKNAER